MIKFLKLPERHLMVNTTMYKCDYRYEVCAGFIHYQKVKTALLLRETAAHAHGLSHSKNSILLPTVLTALFLFPCIATKVR